MSFCRRHISHLPLEFALHSGIDYLLFVVYIIIMNKLHLILFKVFKIIILGGVQLFLSLYFSLWIYVYNLVPKESKNKYNQNIESNLNDEQYDIILFFYNGNKNRKLRNYPFIVDMIIEFNLYKKNMKRLQIPKMTADAITLNLLDNNRGKYTSLDEHIMTYGLIRYIVAKYDYKKCINIIMKETWMGENILGLENACMYYYQKAITDITDEELFSLLVLSGSPSRYKINSDANIRKTKERMDKYKSL
jgi:hypothetical protein